MLLVLLILQKRCKSNAEAKILLTMLRCSPLYPKAVQRYE